MKKEHFDLNKNTIAFFESLQIVIGFTQLPDSPLKNSLRIECPVIAADTPTYIAKEKPATTIWPLFVKRFSLTKIERDKTILYSAKMRFKDGKEKITVYFNEETGKLILMFRQWRAMKKLKELLNNYLKILTTQDRPVGIKGLPKYDPKLALLIAELKAIERKSSSSVKKQNYEGAALSRDNWKKKIDEIAIYLKKKYSKDRILKTPLLRDCLFQYGISNI